MNNNYCVIMAGGVGSRFWPLSRTQKPKQFLDILGTGRTLIQQTFDRFLEICPPKNILIVTSAIYKNLVMEQLPEIPENNILLEPSRRNTAPCVAYANYKILTQNPEANIVVSPADHLVTNTIEFAKIIKESLEFTRKNDVLLTLGIKPSRPETGYGYIQIEDKKDEITKDLEINKVKTFTEKPDLEMAKIFLQSGEFYWNSGVFIWSLKTINKSFKQFLPEVDGLFKNGIEFYNTPKEQDYINKAYTTCQNISLDYGIMEHAENVYVCPADFGWSDLGTWSSLYENSNKDENQNTVKGNDVMLYNTKNCVVNIPDNKLVVIQGIDDIIITESDNILLISTRKDEQLIKQIVTDIQTEKGEEYI